MFYDTQPSRLESLTTKGSLQTLQKTRWGEQNLYKLPSFESPYFAGEPRNDIMELALARYNFIRRFAGLNEAAYNKQFHIEAQYGAWVCAMYNKTDGSHSISAYKQPEGLSDEIWKLVATGISQCMYGDPHAANSVDQYMADNANGNLGHRKNLLNLYTSKVGFGVASANLVGKDKNDPNTTYYTHGATAFRFNWQRQPDYKDFEYDMVSWPPAGYFPAKTALFDSGVDKARWSIYFDGNKYALQTKADANGVKTNVIVTKKVGNTVEKTWNFAEKASNIAYGSTTIFYLDGETFTDGSVYTVRFENLVDKKNGGFTDLEYAVEFFDMSKVQ